MALPMQKRFSVFNEVYLINHLHDILDYSYKWLVYKNYYRCKGPQKAVGFTLTIIYLVKDLHGLWLISGRRKKVTRSNCIIKKNNEIMLCDYREYILLLTTE